MKSIMKNNEYLERRVQKDLIISEDVYISGIFDITQWLILDLEEFIKMEKRYFGIMPIYFESLREYYKEFNVDCTEDMCNIYGKIFYLFKPLILEEFRKLEQKHLSQADRVIVIMKRLLDLIDSVAIDHPKKEIFKGVNNIISKIYDRIRNNGKLTELKYLISSIRDYMERGVIGKIVIDEFGLLDEINKRIQNSKPITSNNVMMEEIGGKEIWTGN